MKVARIAVGAIALVSGALVLVLLGSGGPPAPQTIVQQAPAEMRATPMSEVLVAVAAVPIGGTLTEQNMDWRRWPDEAIGQHFIRRADRPNAREELRSAISRFPLLAGEPINDTRIIKADRPGFLAAILPSGMRALSVPISPETGAGGFILPNDRVDVLLTRRERNQITNAETFYTETVLTNIRVLAIDQTIQERDGEKVVVGRTATMELASRQAEIVALSRQLGELSLALRSLADAPEAGRQTDPGAERTGGSVSIIRYGIPHTMPFTAR